MEYSKMFLGVIDCVVLATVLVICVVIGFVSSRQNKRKPNSVENYFLAGRNMHIIPVAFSIMATNFSAITIASVSTEIYLFGFQYCLGFLVYSVGISLAAFLVAPVFHNDRYDTVYQYIEKRFDRKLRIIFSLSHILGTMIYLGVVLYVPAVSLTVVSGFPEYVTILGIGITCTMYCIVGGFKAVIWTDVVQALLILTTLVLFVIKGSLDAGGFGNVYQQSVESGFLRIMSWYDEINYRHSMIGITLMALYYSLKDVALNQSGAQRILCVKNASDAKRSTYLSSVITIFLSLLLGLCGMVIYVNFRKCDPLQIPKKVSGITSPDQLFVYSIVKFLGEWPGMAGLAIAGLLSSSISTLSSYINAYSAITLEDYMKNYCPGLITTPPRQILVSKILTGMYGLVAVMCAFLTPTLGGAIKAAISTIAVTSGPMGGVFLLGILIRRCNTKAALIGLVVGLLFCLSIQIGSMTIKPHYKTNDLSVTGCPADIGIMNLTSTNSNEQTENKTYFVLFKLGFTTYGPIGLITSFCVGYLTSFLFKREEIDPKLLSPLVLPKKGSKEERNEMESQPLQQDKLQSGKPMKICKL